MGQQRQANTRIPLAPSYNARGIAGFSNTLTNAVDQRNLNCAYELIPNPITGKLTLYLVKRPGVADVGSSYGTTGQVAYLWDLAAGATTTAAANRWVASTSGNDTRVSDTSTTTVVVTAAGYAPAFLDKTAISGTDTALLQIRNGSGVQRAFHASAIGTWTEITDSIFANLAHQGKIEHLNGWAHVATRNRIYSSALNSVSSWPELNYIDRQAQQDIGSGLGKLGRQIVSFGTSTMEVYGTAGNPAGSPLEWIPHLTFDYGMASTIVTGMRHYSAVINGNLFWVGANPNGVYAYNGERVEKVSTVAIDKILAEKQHFHVGPLIFQGQRALAICLDLPDATTQRALLFWPEWKTWSEWSSTVFIPQASPRLGDVCLGVGTNQHKLYAISTASDNWQDAATNYQWLTQFRIPQQDNRRDFMKFFGLVGDTARSALNVAVSYSDDDYQTFTSLGNIDLSSSNPHFYRCGSYTRGRVMRLSYTGSLGLRLEAAIADIE